VLKGVKLVDFEKVNSLEGVYLANQYDVEHLTKRNSGFGETEGKKGAQSEVERMVRMKKSSDYSTRVQDEEMQLQK